MQRASSIWAILTKEYNSVLSGLIEIEYYSELVVSERYILKNTTVSYLDWYRQASSRASCICGIHIEITEDYTCIGTDLRKYIGEVATVRCFVNFS